MGEILVETAEGGSRRPQRSRRVDIVPPGVNAPVDESRRNLLKGLSGIGLVLAGASALGWLGWKTIHQSLESLFDPISDEERKALAKINSIPPDQRLQNLVVGEDGANLRRRPSVPPAPQMTDINPVIETLKPGEVVSEAIAFPGQELLPGAGASAIWYAIPTRRAPNGIVERLAFSHSGNFQPPQIPQIQKQEK